MDEFFRNGFEAAKSIVDTEGATIEFPINDVDAENVESFIDGAIQLFEDRLHAIAGIRYSTEFKTMVESFAGWDGGKSKYHGIPVAFDSSFWPKAKIEIVAGPRVVGNG
ncbi:hypothetical protein ELI41_29630 (plasmid) [Rhizobium leguminosarum]|uniref:hypothetical protein n=1 Tax=Rhizobium leguminosarum TaxID=384 RepID=UPI0010301EE6|nr:hypothetical protein [Rhizobium leguminosarum]TAU80470.1 hypothetical protein ELI41_29630 [Rhizobium leguminosarum]